MGGVTLADRMGKALEERRARIEELAALIEAAQQEEDAELRNSFRSDPAARHDATSRVAQIRRRRAKAEQERDSLIADLGVLEEEARSAAQDAARTKAEDALRRYREFRRAEDAFASELKSDLVALFEKFAAVLPGLWQAERECEDRAFRLCGEAGMSTAFDHAWSQTQSYRAPKNFLGQIEVALRSVRLGELKGEAKTVVERDPGLLFNVRRPEESPAYVEATPVEWAWVDTTSAPLLEIEGPHGRKELVRELYAASGRIHPAVDVRRSEPSDAERQQTDPRTGVERWRRVDASLLASQQ